MARRAAAAVLAMSLLSPATALPQSPGARFQPTTSEPSRPLPDWIGDVVFLGANATIAGLTSGLTQAMRGESFWPAFRTGADGGAIAYGGRRIAVEGFSGAGLLGRQVAAVGTSVAANAADGRRPFEQLVLPVGLVRLYLQSASSSALPLNAHLKFDVPTVLATVYYTVRRETRFDLSASLSSGAPVFESRVRSADGYWAAYQTAGVIWLRGNPDDPNPDHRRSDVLAHERVHVLQYDFTLHLWSDPTERWLVSRYSAGAWVERHLDLGLHLVPWELANRILPYELRPWEVEAHFLSRVRTDR